MMKFLFAFLLLIGLSLLFGSGSGQREKGSDRCKSICRHDRKRARRDCLNLKGYCKVKRCRKRHRVGFMCAKNPRMTERPPITASPTPSVTPTATSAPSSSMTPSSSVTPTPSASMTPSPSVTSTPTSSPTPSPSESPSVSPSTSATPSVSISPPTSPSPSQPRSPPALPTPAIGVSSGDPHMKTYDNFRYDCQAIGEVVLSKSMTGSKFEVQGLFAPSVFFPSRVTVTSGLAMTYHGGPTIEFTTAKEPAYGLTMISGCPVAVFVDGKLTNISRNRVFPDGSQIIRDSGRISAHFPNGLSVYADTSQTGFNRCWFRVAVVKLSGKIIRDDGNIVGLLGSPNGNSSDEWMNRSGTPFNHPFPRLGPVALQYCQGTWGVKKADSLFADHHSRPTVTPPKPYIKIPDLKDVPPEVLAICGPLNIDCQLDGLVGGVEFAREALDNMDLIEEIEKMPEVTPPPFPGPNQSHEPMERILTSDDRPYVKRSVQYNSIQDI